MPTSTRFRQLGRCLYLLGLAATLCTTLGGCAKPERASPIACRVLIDGVPALEVRLVLLRTDLGEPQPVLEGVADSAGTIAMKFVEDSELSRDMELELTPLIEPIGNGDWELNAPWSDPKKTPLKVKWPASEDRLDILLPKKAVRSI